MLNQEKPRDRRAVLGSAALALALLVLFRGVPYVRSWESRSLAQADTLSRRLKRIRIGTTVLSAQRDSLRSRLRQLRILDSVFVSAASPNAAGAVLTEHIYDAADDAGAHVDQTQILAVVPTSSVLARCRVSASATGDLDAIVSMLASLEEGTPLLAIRELSIASSGVPTAGKAESLRADFVVEAVLRAPMKPSSIKGR